MKPIAFFSTWKVQASLFQLLGLSPGPVVDLKLEPLQWMGNHGRTTLGVPGVLWEINLGLAWLCTPVHPVDSPSQKGGTRVFPDPLSSLACTKLGEEADSALTWKAMVPASLHVESCQVQPDPPHLPKQPVPELIH